MRRLHKPGGVSNLTVETGVVKQQLESARREQEALMSKTDEMKISNKHFRTE